MEKAMEIATENGFTPAGADATYVMYHNIGPAHFAEFRDSHGPCHIDESEILLRKEFWECFGKGLGWYVNSLVKIELDGKHHSDASLDVKEANRRTMIDTENNLGVIMQMTDTFLTYSPYKKDQLTWLDQWHRFIDHLAEGKPADEFFTELIKKYEKSNSKNEF